MGGRTEPHDQGRDEVEDEEDGRRACPDLYAFGSRIIVPRLSNRASKAPRAATRGRRTNLSSDEAGESDKEEEREEQTARIRHGEQDSEAKQRSRAASSGRLIRWGREGNMLSLALSLSHLAARVRH